MSLESHTTMLFVWRVVSPVTLSVRAPRVLHIGQNFNAAHFLTQCWLKAMVIIPALMENKVSVSWDSSKSHPVGIPLRQTDSNCAYPWERGAIAQCYRMTLGLICLAFAPTFLLHGALIWTLLLDSISYPPPHADQWFAQYES